MDLLFTDFRCDGNHLEKWQVPMFLHFECQSASRICDDKARSLFTLFGHSSNPLPVDKDISALNILLTGNCEREFARLTSDSEVSQHTDYKQRIHP